MNAEGLNIEAIEREGERTLVFTGKARHVKLILECMREAMLFAAPVRVWDEALYDVSGLDADAACHIEIVNANPKKQ